MIAKYFKQQNKSIGSVLTNRNMNLKIVQISHWLFGAK